ncbi:ribonuclease H family protein [Solemya velum gill symbiont]|uniref:ribonuclease H family protein n=1 Tax=Solemya velum gill symbiont TaxID=2340 RepID=UPI0018A8038D|nr:ribonuclease H family protein [Solemya velum gill symbiont]
MAFQSLFAQIRHTYSTHQPFYTDGSKDQEKVSAPPSVDTTRLPNNSSIFSAELYALLIALQNKSSKFIVFTDSLSSLQSLNSFKITHPLVLQFLEFYNFLLQKGKTIVFCCIPSHMGVRGNEKVDSIAETALNSDMSSFKVPYSDFKPFSKNT